MRSHRVAVVRCRDYQSLDSKLERLLGLVGAGELVRPGDRVFLKVNGLGPHPPGRAVTTHPELVQSLCRYFVSAGARVAVGDSAGGMGGQSHTNRALEASGIAAAARAAGARVCNLDARAPVPVANPRPGGPDPLYLAPDVLETDWLVNVPKLKTHLLTGLTAAVKNLYGCLPGAHKRQLHCRYPGVDEFSDVLLDIEQVLRPSLHVLDAVVAMEGNGPTFGRPVVAGLLMAAGDAVALDMAAARAAGWDPNHVTTHRAALRRGLAPAGPELVGELPLTKSARRFQRPVTHSLAHWVPSGLIGTAMRLAGPVLVLDAERCTGCGFCVGACPAQALDVSSGRAVIDKERCVACYCCAELCPSGAPRLTSPLSVRAWQDLWRSRRKR